MIYVYRCLKCKEIEEIIKPVARIDTPEHCTICGTEMVRVPGKGTQVSVPNLEGLEHTFGKRIANRAQLRDEIRQMNDKYGWDLQEVGNERPKKKDRVYKFKEETLVEANRELKRLRGH